MGASDIGVTSGDGDEATAKLLDPSGSGVAGPTRGIREFVIGTGGKNHYAFSSPPLANEELRNNDTVGVLKLTLHPPGTTGNSCNTAVANASSLSV